MQGQQCLQVWKPGSHAGAEPPVQALPGAKSGSRCSNSSALQSIAQQLAAHGTSASHVAAHGQSLVTFDTLSDICLVCCKIQKKS